MYLQSFLLDFVVDLIDYRFFFLQLFYFGYVHVERIVRLALKKTYPDIMSKRIEDREYYIDAFASMQSIDDLLVILNKAKRSIYGETFRK